MATTAPSEPTIFVGRQPIFDRQQKVVAYELLYRSNGTDNAFNSADGNGATTQVMNSSLNTVGIDEIVGKKKAFINITRQLLIDQAYTVFPKDRVVVELLETVEPDEEVIAACRALKKAGYSLALDDFVFSPKYKPLVEMADIIKIDFLASSPADRRAHLEQFGGGSALLLAEKVENQADVQEAMSQGYAYLQGYFFCKPEIISASEIPSVKQNYLRFIQAVNEPNLDYSRLELAIKCEVSLSSKLLRYLNSASVGVSNKITSIHQALTMLGEGPLRKWASLVAVSTLGEDKPIELLSLCLVRARFCEVLAPEIGFAGRELDLFMMGLFSAMDVLMNRPFNELTSQMPVAPDVAAALLGANTSLGKVFGLALAFERGNGVLLNSRLSKLNISAERSSQLYRQSVSWASQSMAA